MNSYSPDYSCSPPPKLDSALPHLEETWRAESGRIIDSLFARDDHGDTPRLLHLGCGPNVLDGWVNTDCNRRSEAAYYLDVMQPFPIGNRSVDRIFCEHLIEHLTLKEAIGMLKECRRVLRPGGRIRIATPDLSQILSLYLSESESMLRYKSWAIVFNRFPNFPGINCLLVNNFMHAWGHKFIYDQPTLTYLLDKIGFSSVERYPVGISSDPAFCGVERHGLTIGVDANEFETMVFEAAGYSSDM